MRLVTILVTLIALSVSLAAEAQFENRKQEQYKRHHLRVFRLLVDGDLENARKELAATIEWHGEDAESLFAEGVLRAHEGDAEAAVETFQRALDRGLPLSRIYGSRVDLLAPLAETEAFQAFLTAHPSPLVHGPMLGQVKPDGVTLWVRTAEPATVRVSAAPTLAFRDIAATAEAETTTARGNTAQVTLTGLGQDTEYFYRLFVDDEAIPYDYEHRFRTATPEGEGAQWTLAFGGGAGFVPPHEDMWDTIHGRHPDSLLLLGDNVYSDDPERPAIQRFCYNRRQSEPRFRRLVAQTPVYAIWDDHDFGDNDCHGGPEVDNPAWKIPVWEMFKRQWPNPGYGTDDMPGIWFSFKRDNVEFFCLDGRYYRTDPKKGRDGSMLGPVQLQWLLDGLTASDATFKVIATPVPFAKGTKPGSRDTWDGYPEEREKIVSHIRDNQIEGVMILSADRHRSDLWKIENEGLYPLYEMESSRLTNQHVHETMPAAVFSYNASQSFGLVHFDTVSEPAQFTYEIVSRAGRTIYTHTITKDDLTFRE